MNKSVAVYLDRSVLRQGHSLRGVGQYTSLLYEALSQQKGIELVTTAKEAQVVHYPFFDLFFATLPLIHRQKVVVTIHDVIPLQFAKQYWPGIKGWLRFGYQRLALSRVQAVVTDSYASQTAVLGYLGLSTSRCHVVPLAANPELSPASESEISTARRRYQLKTPYVLYVGDINYNKNIPELIKMVGLLPPEIQLVCVGAQFFPHSIPEWQWIETQLAASDVRNRVKFVTDVKKEENLYHRCI